MSKRIVAAIAAVTLAVPVGAFGATAAGVRAHSVTNPPQRVVDWSADR